MSKIDLSKLLANMPKIEMPNVSNFSANMAAIEEERIMLEQEAKEKEEKKRNRSSIIRDVLLIITGIILTHLFDLAIDIYKK